MSLRLPKEIAFVTSNEGKFEEMVQLMPFVKLRRVDLDLPEIQGTPREIAKKKCLKARKHIDGPFFIEDTGLQFNALQEMPGPYIKDFLKSIGTQGLVKMLGEFEDKSALGYCVIAYSPGPDQEIIGCTGTVEGTIVPPRGPAKSFGWDAIFVPKEDPYQRTFAQMSKQEKCNLSHRKDAANKFEALFQK